jgi:nucleotide-binding universal stress UspA family protein
MDVNYQRLLVPVDGTAGDERVLAVSRQLVQKHPIAITLIYVVEVLQSMPLDAELPAEIARGEAVLSNAESVARRHLANKADQIFTELLQARSAGAAIVDESIERNADAIVMTASNRRLHGRTTLGDTVTYVMKNAPCDVIVIRLAPAGETRRG